MGAHAMMAGVPDGDDQHLVRVFGTYTGAREGLADWGIDRGIPTVAMASTGVSWLPRFATLAARGLPGCVSSAASITRVPGRTSDGLDGPWMQTLHRSGVRAASLRPDADCVARRPLLRHRAHLLQPRAPHVLHMQQAL
jgi:transposase